MIGISVEALHAIFVSQDYRWSVGGKLIRPSEDDLQTCLDRMQDVLHDGDIGMSVEVGRLRMEKTELGYEVYIWMGMKDD